MIFERIFYQKWSRNGVLGEAQMETKMIEFRGHFATPSQEPSRGGFGEGSGWILGAFWEGSGRDLG